MRTRTLLLVAAVAAGTAAGEENPSVSAFRFEKDKSVKHSIELEEVMKGVLKKGDPRDVIPTLRKPRHAPAAEAAWVTDRSRVLGLVVNGEARAYPLYILQVHELANDVLGGVPVAPNY